MSEQLIGGLAPVGIDQVIDRTGGPVCNYCECVCEAPISPDYGVPLQEQVEQVEDALSKALSVIEAFVALELELRNDVYQAQVEAQDWQNQFNQLKRDFDQFVVGSAVTGDFLRDAVKECVREQDVLKEQLSEASEYIADRERLLENCRDLLRAECLKNDDASVEQESFEGLYELRGNRMLELQAKVETLENINTTWSNDWHALAARSQELQDRISFLTDANNALEVRNERQGETIISCQKISTQLSKAVRGL